MKIVSLQSVGLVTFYVQQDINHPVYTPQYFAVGYALDDLRGGRETDREGNVIAVTSIKYNELGRMDKPEIIARTYQVDTSDGHIRVLPADKYIAEWGE